MFTQVCLSLVLLVAIPAWSQVSTSEGVGLGITDEMHTPPPVSGDAYPTAVGSEIRIKLSARRIGRHYRIH